MCEAIIFDRSLRLIIDQSIVAKAKQIKRRINEGDVSKLGLDRLVYHNDLPFWCFDCEQKWVYFTPRGIPIPTPALLEDHKVVKQYQRLFNELLTSFPAEAKNVMNNQSVVMMLRDFDENVVFNVWTNRRLKDYIVQLLDANPSKAVDAAVVLLVLCSLIAGQVVATSKIGQMYRELSCYLTN